MRDISPRLKERRERERNKKKRSGLEFNYCSGHEERHDYRVSGANQGLHLSQFRPAGWETTGIGYVFFSFARRCNLVRVHAGCFPPRRAIHRALANRALGVNDGIAIIRASFITRTAVIHHFFLFFLRGRYRPTRFRVIL